MKNLREAVRIRVVCERCGEVYEWRMGTVKDFTGLIKALGWSIKNDIVLCPVCSDKKDNI